MFLESRRTRRGSLFLEGAIAMAVIAVVFGILAWRQTQTSRDARDAAAAAGLRTVQQAVATVITRNFDAMLGAMSAQCDPQATACPNGSARSFALDAALPGIGTSLGDAGLLPPGFATENVHGQRYEIWLKKTGAARLEGLVLTTGGTTLSDARATEIATRADASDGGVVRGSGIVHGAYGGWLIDLQSYRDASGAIAPPGTGHVAALLRFDDSRAIADYIHRFPTGNGTEPQTMHTALDMGGQAILNASDLTVRFSITLVPDAITVGNGCAGKEGRVAAASLGEPVVCVVENTGPFWRRIALLPACSNGQFITVDAQNRLACTN